MKRGERLAVDVHGNFVRRELDLRGQACPRGDAKNECGSHWLRLKQV
jgi:hypothetical protein